MLNRKNAGIAALMGTALFFSTQVNAAAITEGFENAPGSYDLYNDPGATAAVTNAQFHSGVQSLSLSIPDGVNYARVKLGESGLTLGAITGADYWVQSTTTNVTLAPYLLLTVGCTTCNPTHEILAIMKNPPDTGIFPPPSPTGWFDIVVNLNTTQFNLYDNTLGQYLLNSTTLAALSSGVYNGVSGSSAVSAVRIGLGLAGGSDLTTYSYNVDDLTINTAETATPLPAALPLFATGLGVMGLLARRRKRKTSAALAAA